MKKTAIALIASLILSGCAGFSINVKASYVYTGEEAAKAK